MIEMPKRSVTRFFIPLVDIMMLLFSMFLLLPILEVGGQGEKEKTAEQERENLKQALANARKQVNELSAEVSVLRKYADPAMNLEMVRKEIEELKKSKADMLKKKLFVQMLRFDPETKKLMYFETEPKVSTKYIVNAQDADKLIKDHQHQAKIMEKELLYFMVIPFKTVRPEEMSKIEDWFKNALTEIIITPK